jgi:indolepyruvate ferredoxin oxidoreductase beta subunit
VILTGVGGQGNVLAGRIVAGALLESGYEVTVGDVFGLSQRGGAVASHIRFRRGGPLPPFVPFGQLDILVGFEPMEALRILCQFGNTTTVALVNTQPILPLEVLRGRSEYPHPEALLERMRQLAKSVIAIDGGAIVRQVGKAQVLNMVMVGALVGSRWLHLPARSIEKQIRAVLPRESQQINRDALAMGIQEVQSIDRMDSRLD